LASIRFQLETLALEKNRLLCAIKVDGVALNLAENLLSYRRFSRVEAETIHVEQLPLQLVQTALRQCAQLKGHLRQAVARMMINDSSNARHLWWNLASELKHPLVTLGLLSNEAYELVQDGGSVSQLRNGHLQQLAVIMREIDKLPCSDDPTALSDSLEEQVFPWLARLEKSLTQALETLLARQWSKGGIATVKGPPQPHTSCVSFFAKTFPPSGQIFGT
jgi:hypothetical protein